MEKISFQPIWKMRIVGEETEYPAPVTAIVALAVRFVPFSVKVRLLLPSTATSPKSNSVGSTFSMGSAEQVVA